MMIAPRGYILKIVARSDGRAGQKKKNFRQRIHDPPRLSIIGQDQKML